MIKPRLILCGGVTLAEDDPLCEGRHTVELRTHGPKANVNVRLEDLAKVFSEHVSPRLEDLLEIAAYVYTADCTTRRGGQWADDDTTEPWDREFQFVVPVRDLDFWIRDDVNELLIRMLRALSDDKFAFRFSRLVDEPPKHEPTKGRMVPDKWGFQNTKKKWRGAQHSKKETATACEPKNGWRQRVTKWLWLNWRGN